MKNPFTRHISCTVFLTPSRSPILAAIIHKFTFTLYTFVTVWQCSVIWCLLSSLTPRSRVYIILFHPKHMSTFSTIYFVRFLEAGFLSMIKLPLCSVWRFKHFIVCIMNFGSLRWYEADIVLLHGLVPFWEVWLSLMGIKCTNKEWHITVSGRIVR